MESGPLKIGIACFPLIGGSGILATALGSELARSQRLDLYHVHYAVPHALAACLASQIVGPSAPRIVTTLHGSDTTLLGQDPSYRTAIEHALVHSDAVTAVSESLRNETEEIFSVKRAIEVIPNFFTPNKPKRSREEVRRALGVTD